MTESVDSLSELSEGDRVVWDGRDSPVTVQEIRGSDDLGTLAVDIQYPDGETDALLYSPVGFGDCMLYSTGKGIDGLRRVTSDAGGRRD